MDPTGNFWFIPFIIAVVKGALIGAAVGAAVAAATGQNIWQGVMTGAISGAIFGGIGSFGLKGVAHTLAHTIGGAASGAANGAITGGDIGMNALIGGLSAGASEYLGNNVGFLKDVAGNSLGSHLTNMLRRAFIGSVTGGIASISTGGSFGYGAAQGAKTSAIAYTANEAMHAVAEGVRQAKDALSTDKNKLAQTRTDINKSSNNISDYGCKGRGCVSINGGAGFKWYDLTSWIFPGTNYCGWTKSGPGEPTSQLDVYCRDHDVMIRKANASCLNIFNPIVNDAHDKLINYLEGFDEKEY